MPPGRAANPEILKRIKRVPGKVISLPGPARSLIQRKKIQDEVFREAEKQKKEVDSQLKMALGDAEIALFEDKDEKGKVETKAVKMTKTHVKESKPREYDRVDFRIVKGKEEWMSQLTSPESSSETTSQT